MVKLKNQKRLSIVSIQMPGRKMRQVAIQKPSNEEAQDTEHQKDTQNCTAYTYPQAMAYKEAAHLHDIESMKMMPLALMVVCALGFLLGVTGNGFIILNTGCRKKTVNATWHLNMGIACFMFAIFLPLTVVQLAMGFHWYLRSVLCNITNIVTSFSMFSSSFHLTVMSADRCISTVFPVWAQNHRTVHLASLITLGVWIVAVIASWRYHGLCSDQSLFLRETGEAANVGIRFLVGFLVPLALISLCLVTLAAKLGRNREASSKRPLQTLLVLHIVFFLCWFPYHVVTFLQTLLKSSSPETTESLESGAVFAYSLLCFNSCFYPFFYLIKRQHFLCCWRQRQNHQTPVNMGSELVELGGNR